MDRNIVYPGSIPLDTDLLNAQKSTMIALGFLMHATFGSGTYFDGLPCTQTTVPSMSIQIGAGSVMSVSTVDNTAFGSLPPDVADPLIKMGINLATTTLLLTAPTTTGYSINYLVEGAFQETDQTPLVLPYYNSTMPSVPFSGPANTGAAQNTQRLQRVNIQLKAGTPATTGTQTTPAVDGGFFPLYVITVAYGAISVVNANISLAPGAPFVPTKLTGGTFYKSGSGVTTTGNGDTINFATPFPTACTQVVITEASGGGWGGTPAPTIYAHGTLSKTGFLVYGVRVTSGTAGYSGGLSFDYVAFGS